MKSLKKLFWAGVVATFVPDVGFAQTDGSTGGTTTGGTTTMGGASGGSLGSSSLSGNYGGGTGNSASTGTAITIAPPSQVQTSNSMSSSNILGQYYANPMYQGRSGTAGSSTTSITNPGGFNTALYGSGGTGGTGGIGSRGTGGGGSAAPSGVGGTGGFAASTGATGATGRAGGTGTTGFGGTTGAGATGTTGFGGTGTTGRTTGAFGGNTSLGGGGGFGNTGGGLGGATSQQNAGMISPRPIAYTATYKFPVAVVTPTQQQSELRLMVDTSTQLVSAKDVQVSTKPGGIVVLQGTVKDEDEARLVEGMMRITPGVRDVVNELKFPKTP